MDGDVFTAFLEDDGSVIRMRRAVDASAVRERVRTFDREVRELPSRCLLQALLLLVHPGRSRDPGREAETDPTSIAFQGSIGRPHRCVPVPRLDQAECSPADVHDGAPPLEVAEDLWTSNAVQEQGQAVQSRGANVFLVWVDGDELPAAAPVSVLVVALLEQFLIAEVLEGPAPTMTEPSDAIEDHPRVRHQGRYMDLPALIRDGLVGGVMTPPVLLVPLCPARPVERRDFERRRHGTNLSDQY